MDPLSLVVGGVVGAIVGAAALLVILNRLVPVSWMPDSPEDEAAIVAAVDDANVVGVGILSRGPLGEPLERLDPEEWTIRAVDRLGRYSRRAADMDATAGDEK